MTTGPAGQQILLTVFLVLAARVGFRLSFVKGVSMEPALLDGQVFLIDKLTYRWLRSPRYGDIIVFKDPLIPGRDLVKRLIAGPGETVQIADGLVSIDGRPCREPITSPPRWRVWGPRVIPPGHFFVLGDNQNASKDSLSWGPLPSEYVFGKVRRWPGNARLTRQLIAMED